MRTTTLFLSLAMAAAVAIDVNSIIPERETTEILVQSPRPRGSSHARAAQVAFWSRFLKSRGLSHRTRPFDIFHFGDNGKGSEVSTLTHLVLSGKKVGSSALLRDYKARRGYRMPKRGSLSLILNAQNMPVCVIEDTNVRVMRFGSVPAEFAMAEGEGNCDSHKDKAQQLKCYHRHWVKVHKGFFGRELRRHRKRLHGRTKLVLENFKVVYRE